MLGSGRAEYRHNGMFARYPTNVLIAHASGNIDRYLIQALNLMTVSRQKLRSCLNVQCLGATVKGASDGRPPKREFRCSNLPGKLIRITMSAVQAFSSVFESYSILKMDLLLNIFS